MATIKISELRPVGAELFQDSESFLDELNSQEMTAIAGGDNNILSVVAGISVNLAIAVSQNINIGQVISAAQG
jgi:predicted regulator of Ras-like GTPase activity (Roadblock/LC7/MglB family)